MTTDKLHLLIDNIDCQELLNEVKRAHPYHPTSYQKLYQKMNRRNAQWHKVEVEAMEKIGRLRLTELSTYFENKCPTTN